MKHKRKAPYIHVAVVDSAPIWFAGFTAMLDSESGLRMTPVALSEMGAAGSTDVVVMNGRSAQGIVRNIETLRALRSDVRILVMGSGTNDEAIQQALECGAKGYVNEDASLNEIVRAIRIVAEGLIWSPRRVIATFIDRSGESLANDFFARRRISGCGKNVTSREKEVLEMLTHGRSNKEIALSLGIEVRTVKAHVAKLKSKTGADSRVTLSLHAITHSLVSVN